MTFCDPPHARRRRTVLHSPTSLLDREGDMANDDRINVRVSVQEYRMDMLLEIVEEIRANHVSKAYLNEVVSHLATKEDLRLMATKEDLKLYATREDLKQYATKEDLKLLADR